MTALETLLLRQIGVTGPLTVADFMQACLLHPEHGYYATRPALGREGDFVTAPEISQMFGEMLGLALSQSWIDQGRPSPFALAELGPGRGTLMADMLRATRSVPGFNEAAEIHLVEASPAMRTAQATLLADHRPVWHDSVDSLPDAPLFLVANEFFDALPVRQFLRDGEGWRERLVGAEAGRLVFGLGPVSRLAALEARAETAAPGEMVETCATATAIAETIGARIAAAGGAALIVDYGVWESAGDTLQAVRAHRKVPPLSTPGEADLTAHVAFGPIAAAAGCGHAALTPQGVFLERLGITDRARILARGLAGEALDQHVSAHRRLTHPEAMGHLFQVLALHPSGQPPPPGVDP